MTPSEKEFYATMGDALKVLLPLKSLLLPLLLL